MFFNLFGSGSETQPQDTKSFLAINLKPKKVYVVLHQTTQVVIGVFENLDKAKEAGRLATHCNCSIMEFTLNDTCRYLNTPIYEDK